MKTEKKSNEIKQFLSAGELNGDETTIQEIMDTAGTLLDHSESGEICGNVLFRTADGVFRVGNVEFCVGVADKDYLINELLDNEYYECEHCGYLEARGDMVDVHDQPRCTECHYRSIPVTEKRAEELAKGQT